MQMRVLLTNDDGIQAAGLQALRRALLGVPGVELAVIAPDGNRSAMARSITTRRPLWVEEVDFGDGTVGYATDGTPDRKSTRLNSSHVEISYAVFCLKKKNITHY